MEVLNRILTQVRTQAHMTSQNSRGKSAYKCYTCQDTGWAKTKTGYKRCSCYEKEHAKMLWKSFGVDPSRVKTLNDYNGYDDVTKKALYMAKAYIRNFESIRDTEENSFGLFGQPGAGKSYIAIAIGAALLNRKNPVQVIYMPYLEAMRELKANVNDDEYYLRLSNRYQRASVLIIDDLFKDKVKNGQLIKDRYGNKLGLSDVDIKHIMPIINYRYFNKLPTLVSTECTMGILVELDEALARRILEPCGYNKIVFKGAEHNYKMRKFVRG